MRLSRLIDRHTWGIGQVSWNHVAQFQACIPVVTVQYPEVVTGNPSLLEDTRHGVAGIGIQGEDEGLYEALRETVDETEEEKGGRKTSECYPKVL